MITKGGWARIEGSILVIERKKLREKFDGISGPLLVVNEGNRHA